MNAAHALVLAAAVAAVPAVALADDAAIQRIPYGTANPPTVTCTPLYVCDLQLQRGEKIQNVAIGDSVRWIVSPALAGNPADGTPELLIKPSDADLGTNVIVTTDRRTYAVNLHSTKTAPPSLHYGYTYPADELAPKPAATPTATPAPTPTATPAPAAPLHFAYALGGDRGLRPVRVYDDGKHVYVELDPHVTEMPALLAVGPDGDQLVNYRVTDGHTYVVDGVPEKLALVLGSGKHQQRVTIVRQ